MGAGGGFTVDPDGLKAVAHDLDDVGRRWQQVGATFDETAQYGLFSFGSFGLGLTWTGFVATWSDEIDLTGTAIAQLSERVKVTAEQYAEAERRTHEHIKPR